MNRQRLWVPAVILTLANLGFSQGKQTLSFQVAGKQRNTNFYVPTGVSKPPVVFFIHGANGSGPAFENETKGDVTADKEKFIAVYPSASSNGATGTWDDMSGTTNFPFFLAILDTLDARYKIDRNKVYMTGFSQGGFISFVAGCSYSNVFAAIAPVSGHAGATCTLKRPVPVFLTFGAQEDKVSFGKDADIWLKLDKCPSTSTKIAPYPPTKSTSKVTRITWGPCDAGTTVIMDSISQQGHQWPSSSNLVQADEVWAFFKDFSLASSTAIQKPNLEISREKFSAIYAAGVVQLRGVGDHSQIEVTDIQGNQVGTFSLEHGCFSFKNRPTGVYFVSVKDGFPGRITAGRQKFTVP